MDEGGLYLNEDFVLQLRSLLEGYTDLLESKLGLYTDFEIREDDLLKEQEEELEDAYMMYEVLGGELPIGSGS